MRLQFSDFFQAQKINFQAQKINFQAQKVNFQAQKIDFQAQKIDFHPQAFILKTYFQQTTILLKKNIGAHHKCGMKLLGFDKGKKSLSKL